MLSARPKLVIGRPACLVAGALLVSGCSLHVPRPVQQVEFTCGNGASFAVRYGDTSATVITRTGRFDVEPRTSSIGRKFASADVTFIHDDDRAVLHGTGDGPYKRCHEIR